MPVADLREFGDRIRHWRKLARRMPAGNRPPALAGGNGLRLRLRHGGFGHDSAHRAGVISGFLARRTWSEMPLTQRSSWRVPFHASSMVRRRVWTGFA